jgi:putative transposase
MAERGEASVGTRRDSGFSPVPSGRGGSLRRADGVSAFPERFVIRKSRPRLRGFSYQGEYAYHVTIRTANSRRVFEDTSLGVAVASLLEASAESCRFALLAYCFMPDHLHLLVQGQEEDADLKKFVALFKQRTGFVFKQRTGRPLWQASYFDRALRRDEDLQAVADCVLQNPVKEGLAAEVHLYPLSGGTYFDGLQLEDRHHEYGSLRPLGTGLKPLSLRALAPRWNLQFL